MEDKIRISGIIFEHGKDDYGLMEYAFSKLNFEKAEKQKEKKEKETIWKIWYRDENGKIRKCIRSDYDLKRSRDIHSRIITMIKWK